MLLVVLPGCPGDSSPIATEGSSDTSCAAGAEGCTCLPDQTCADGSICDPGSDTCVPGGGPTTSSPTTSGPTTSGPTTSTTDADTVGTTESDTNSVTTTTASDPTTGGNTTIATTTGTGTTGDTDTTGGDDPFISVSGPDWIHYITGHAHWANVAEPLPGGQVFVTGGGGLYGKYITLGTDTPEEITYNVAGHSSFAEWLDGGDGKRLSSHLLSTTKSPMDVSSAFSRLVAVAPNGDITVSGQWWGENSFHQGTPYESVMKAESLVVNNNTYRATDPFFTQMDESGAVHWLGRGRTPGPLTTSPQNTPLGLVALPDGDTMIIGHYDYPGFVVGDGTPGAKAMTGTLSAYMARLDGDGVPAWVAECEGKFSHRYLAASPNGAVYALTVGSMTLFKGEAGELHVPEELDDVDPMSMSALVRIDPTGEPLWVRRIILTGGSSTFRVVGRDDDSVVVAVRSKGELQIRDEQGIAASLAPTSSNIVAASITADGAVEWALETGLADGVQIAHVDNDVWITGSLPAGADSVKLGDQVLPLPPLDFDPALDLQVMIRVSPGGVALEARVIGAGMWVEGLSTDGLSMLVTGAYYCDLEGLPTFFDDMGVGTPMPSACDQPDTEAKRGYVMSIPL